MNMSKTNEKCPFLEEWNCPYVWKPSQEFCYCCLMGKLIREIRLLSIRGQ